ncbi:MAG TPA: CoA pyrophosphatase [Candidatus Copromorpha excrementipullorum]|uniref:CoA pyrophosphatase n=1 Tax=Candidatus Allocopromorpha excrementipullorum TaxID=2840743 RepID=A0A9D1SVK1_9FIRM|nr:CoA pyrophosphatase [Candidatus Copromorpha excrementipullorum]
MSLRKNLTADDIRHIFDGKKAGNEEFFKFFSVLVPVVEKEGKLYLLYERRARDMKRQPGEICFPGGELEQDETTKECALRETWEEIGIPQESIRVVGQLDTIYTYSNFAMYCYLGIVDAKALDHMVLNPGEVEEAFLVELDWLLTHEPEIYWTDVIPEPPEGFPYEKVTGGMPYSWRKGKAPVPVYEEYDGNVIWGLTARITKRFTDVIKGVQED